MHTTAAWIHERISGLPEDAPAPRRPSAAAAPTPGKDSSGGLETPQDRRGHPDPRRRPSSTQPPPPIPQAHPPPTITTTTNLPSQTTAPGQQGQSHLHLHPQPPPLPSSSSPPDPDPIYQATRLAALLYTRAISHRQPFSRTVTPPQFHLLWATAWRVPLCTWRSLLGVLNWILLPLVSVSSCVGSFGGSGGNGGGQQPHERFVKGMVNISLFQMGLEDWEVGRGVVERGGRLQWWLGGGDGGVVRDGGEERGNPSKARGDEMGGGSWREGVGSLGGEVGGSRRMGKRDGE